jgi:hypothetical protein
MLCSPVKKVLIAGLIGLGVCLPASAEPWLSSGFTIKQFDVPYNSDPSATITLILCLEGQPCPRGWTSSNLRALAVGVEKVIPVGVDPFVFDLGDQLTGTHRATISSSFAAKNPQLAEELFVVLADSFNYSLDISSQGSLSFDAVEGTPYYLFVRGLLRGGESYSVTVFQVAEPSSVLLLGTSGMLMWLVRRRQKRLSDR